MRIIAGKLKGSILHLSKNKKTRPLKDIARESIFNLIIHSNKFSFKIEQANILDLYAGTGSFGLECLSRGAKNVFFVEKEKETIEILKKNIEKFKLQNKTKIFINEIFYFLERQNFLKQKFDLVFCDPPFKDTNIEKLIEVVAQKNLLKKNGLIIIHRHKNSSENLQMFVKILDERFYGISKIIFSKPLF